MNRMNRTTRGMTTAALATLALVGCDEMAPRGRGGRDAGAPTTDAHVVPGVDAARMRIDLGPLPPDPALDAMDRTRAASCPASARWIVAVRGRVVDENGAPIEEAYVQSCLLQGGSDRRVCLRPAISAADGVFTAILPEESRCVDELALRMLVPDSSLATGYCSIPEDVVDGVIVPSRPLVLVDTAPARTLPPAGDPTSMREIAFDGLTLMASPDAIGPESYDAMAAVVVPGSLATETCLGDGTPMDLLVAFSPEEGVELVEGLPTRIDASGFSPGESVELFVLGGLAVELANGAEVREGHWHRFATATVAGDGTVSTGPGAGLPYLGWLGLRRPR